MGLDGALLQRTIPEGAIRMHQVVVGEPFDQALEHGWRVRRGF
jgi:hypothetical protein